MFKGLIQSAILRFGYYLRSTNHFGDTYWSDLVALLTKENSRTPVIFDVGAHHGETLLSLREHFPTARIHCFEPDPESFGILSTCAKSLSHVILHPVALGATAGEAQFHRNSESMTNSLLPTSAESLESDYAKFTVTQNVIQVPVETLDGFCHRENIDWIDVLKTDCQGYDLMVLQGGEKMISAHQIGLVTCELIFDQEYDGQGKFHELLGFLDGYNYRLIGFYNMSRNRHNECTYCDAIFSCPPKTQ